MPTHQTDRCTYCGCEGHSVAYCPRKQCRGWTLAVGLMVMAVMMTGATAQDELTKEQVAEKCKAGGGCALVTRDDLMDLLRGQFRRGLEAGVQSCTKPS